MGSSSPTPDQILAVAKEVGYKESRTSVSATLFLVQTHTAVGDTPVTIHIYHTTRSIMTLLNHPTRGINRLYRSHAYDTLDDLKEFLLDPRRHTAKGYREASNAMRVCTECNALKTRTDFSNNQWKVVGPDKNQCKDCVATKPRNSRTPSTLTSTSTTEPSNDEEVTELIGLTDDLLKLHDTHQKQSLHNKDIKNLSDRMERRQFNCPACPKHGRGAYVFFKKVPVTKPVVKCPQCKLASRGQCSRLYPVEVAKGYGLFQCRACNDKWGSSRAIHHVTQECATCRSKGTTSMVAPFRLEIWKPKRRTGGGGGGGGGGKPGPRRIPREPISEEVAHEPTYSSTDHQRNDTGAQNALVPDAAPRSYDVAPLDYPAAGPERTLTVGSTVGVSDVPQEDRHKCSACATGACKSRRVQVSQIHDVSDGNTVSTRASLVTNSSIDKSDFLDRDEDFSGFDEISDTTSLDSSPWVEV